MLFYKLDREVIVSYKFVIFVFDYGCFLLSFIVIVLIEVFDVNDNLFKFNSLKYYVYVKESIFLGS